MKMFRKSVGIAILLAVALMALLLAAVQAGSSLDFGQLSGLPVAANYVAWRSLAGTPPVSVITEDSYNSTEGPNGGYGNPLQPTNPFWLVDVSKLPGANDLDEINMLFGGLGADAGTLWTHSFTWDNTEATTDHGTVATTMSGSCPVMQPGALNGDQKTINWTAPIGHYLIYSSTLTSNGPGGQSNGEYGLVAFITTTSTSGTYIDTLGAGITESWHIVIPADIDGSIIGCHSEESNPNAVRLATFQSVGAWGSPLMALGAGALGMVALGLGLRRWRKAA